ncbi:minor capsid protein [Lachnospiraceae bacterium LCP25S3_G4]
MSFKFEMKNLNQLLDERGLEERGKVQRYVDSEVLKKCDPYVPFDQGEYKRSGIGSTKIGSGEVSYHTPYARKWYYVPAQFQGAPMRGNYFFERAMNNGGRTQILSGAKKIAGAK